MIKNKEKETCETIFGEKNYRPSWITDELLTATREAFSSYTDYAESDYVEMILNFSELFSN